MLDEDESPQLAPNFRSKQCSLKDMVTATHVHTKVVFAIVSAHFTLQC